VRALRAVVVRAIPRLLLAGAAAACGRAGEIVVLADTTSRPAAVEAIAIPVGGAAPAMDPAQAAADSAAARFRRERAALIVRADSLAHADRRTPAYAAAYAAYLSDARAAERVRAMRDSLRAAAGAAPPLPAELLARAARAPLAHGAAVLRLPAGPYWVAITDARGALAAEALPANAKAGARDTIRF